MAANAYINLYMNNPTAGATDGTAISTDGTYNAPLSVALDASVNESKKIKLAIRTQSGYETIGDTIISLEGDTNSRWGLSQIEDGTFTSSITILSKITAANVIFWAQASSSSDETPITDRSVSFKVTAAVKAVD